VEAVVSPMTQPLVSVITPCGPRHAEHVRVAAASVAWQSLAPLCEHIIACDGGADVASMSGVVVLPSDGERRGPAHQRNRALAAARGLFTIPLDADDYLLPRTVEHFLRAYSTGRHGYIYGDAYTLERDGSYILRAAPEYNQDHMRRYNIHVVTALTPTKHWRRVGGWDEGVDAWEDWSGHLRLAMAGVCGQRLPYPVFGYRVYEGDRMTRFYGGDPVLMERVLSRYRDREEYKQMASCCGGDVDLARIAADAVAVAPQPDAAPMAGDKVRVEFLGEERGTLTWEPERGRLIRLGNNAMNRYQDVTSDEAQWLIEHGAPIRVVPMFDDPAIPAPLPILQGSDVLTPDSVATRAIRPRRQAAA
jgi:glycosyl transferase family 2